MTDHKKTPLKQVKLEGEAFTKAKAFADARNTAEKEMMDEAMELRKKADAIDARRKKVNDDFWAGINPLLPADFDVKKNSVFIRDYEDLGFYVVKEGCDCPLHGPLHGDEMRRALDSLPSGAIDVNDLPPVLRQELANALISGKVGGVLVDTIRSPKKAESTDEKAA